MRWLLLVLLLLPVLAHASVVPEIVMEGEQGLAAGLSAIQEGVGTGIVVGAGGRDARRAVKAVMAADPTLRIHLWTVDRYGTNPRALLRLMGRYDLPCGVLVLPASPGRWRLVGVGRCVSAPASESFKRVVAGEPGLAVGLSAIQERVGTKVLVAAEGREARKAVEFVIVHGPGLQIAPLYLHGDADRTRRVREEMLRYNLVCGLRVLPFSSTRWKIIGVGECGDWNDLPAEVDVLVPSFQAYEDWNTERPHVEAGNLLEVLEVVGDIGGEILSWPL